MIASRGRCICDTGAGDKIPSEPECGRYIHFYTRSVMDGRARGFGAYIDRDGGGYSAALILVCRKMLPDDVSTVEGFEAMLRREFRNMPKVSAPHVLYGMTRWELTACPAGSVPSLAMCISWPTLHLLRKRQPANIRQLQ